MRLHTWLVLLGCMALCVSGMAAGERAAALRVSDPMRPPGWAVLQRELLRANEAACREFYARYFDRRGYLQCVLRWGGDDGPDDAIECFDNWPILHALGASDEVLRLYKQGWEGHLRQYTEAKTVEVPLAREGMYYQEFPVMFDWLHNGEGLTAFNVQGLSDPRDRNFQRRVRRFAGFYMNEDPEAPNYDPKHRIIRSLFNGSRGPLLRNTTALDWAGDPIEIGARFKPKHGERSFEEMLAHFKDYNDIVGDHPSNLSATTLALNAYMLTQEEKYRRWLLEYVDAWRERIIANGGLLPSKIGLDGSLGGPSGKWYSGVYGWGFIVVVPQTGALAHRNTTNLGLIGFGNAYLLTGDDRQNQQPGADHRRKQDVSADARRQRLVSFHLGAVCRGRRPALVLVDESGRPSPTADHRMGCVSGRREPGLSRAIATRRPGTSPAMRGRPAGRHNHAGHPPGR